MEITYPMLNAYAWREEQTMKKFLAAIRAIGTPCTVKEIAKFRGIGVEHTRRHINKLERKGFIKVEKGRVNKVVTICKLR